MEKLVAIVPLLNQYIALQKVLVVNLSHAHRTCCKLTSILLALFSDLVSKVPKPHVYPIEIFKQVLALCRVYVLLLKLRRWKEREAQTLRLLKEEGLMKDKE